MVRENKYLKYKRSNSGFVDPTADQMYTWLKRNGFEVKDFGEQFRICNPDGDTKFCVAISKQKALFHDFRTNHQQYDGPFISFVSKYKNISYREAVEEVCRGKIHSKIEIVDEAEEEEVEDEIEMPKGAVSVRVETDSKLRQLCMNYLLKTRGLDEDVVLRANIHYLGTEIIVPYYEFGMLVFYQGRKLLNKVFNFPSASETKKKAGDFLYGFDDVEPGTEISIVESIFNALSIGPGCVATGGAKLKEGQIDLIKALNPHTLYLLPDNDGAGIESLKKDFIELNKIRKGDFLKNIFYCLPPYSKNDDDQMDWNDMKKAGIDIHAYIRDNHKKLTMAAIFAGINGAEFK